MILGILAYLEFINGAWLIILGVLSAIFALTTLMNFCPLYALLSIQSDSKEDCCCSSCDE